MKRILFVVAICVTGLSLFADQSSVFYKEVNLIGGYSDNNGWLSDDGHMLMNSVGCEYLGKFSDANGDWLTADIQARVRADFNDDAEQDLALELHNAFLDYKIGLGKTLRIGHFDPAFGLEPVLDTHSTLIQTLAEEDIGFKQDWGAGYRSGTSLFDYQFALQAGTGMGLDRDDDSYAASVRLSNPPGGTFEYGVSILYGMIPEEMAMYLAPVSEMPEELVRKKRVGFDVQYPVGAVTLRTEVSVGKNDDADVVGGLMDLVYSPPFAEDAEIVLQISSWTDDPSNSEMYMTTTALSVQYTITSTLTIRAGVFNDISAPDQNEDLKTVLQLYYYGR